MIPPDLPEPRQSAPPEAAAPVDVGPLPVEAGGAAADAGPAPEAIRPGLATRVEEHLYLHLQRFSFCIDRVRARFAGPGDPGGEAEEVRLSQEIAALDAYLAERYPEPELPLARLRARFGLDELGLSLL